MDEFGILYCAVGEAFYKRALLSHKSITTLNNKIPAAIYTDQKTDIHTWKEVIKADPMKNQSFENAMAYKLDALLKTPFKHTLYLDSDTYILEDISELFSLVCNKFDLVFCHGHNRSKRFKMMLNTFNYSLKKDIPFCFSPLQGGLLLFNKDSTKNLFEKVKERYTTVGYFDDQIILRELLWEENIKIYILPPEYNFNDINAIKQWKLSDNAIATPKIFHYTLDKNRNIKKLVNRKIKRNYPLIKLLHKLKMLASQFFIRFNMF